MPAIQWCQSTIQSSARSHIICTMYSAVYNCIEIGHLEVENWKFYANLLLPNSVEKFRTLVLFFSTVSFQKTLVPPWRYQYFFIVTHFMTKLNRSHDRYLTWYQKVRKGSFLIWRNYTIPYGAIESCLKAVKKLVCVDLFAVGFFQDLA